MTSAERAINIVSEEKKNELIKEIIYYFQKERDEEIGVIAAESIFVFFLHLVGIELYNKGIEDSKLFLRERFEDMELDMDSLLRNT